MAQRRGAIDRSPSSPQRGGILAAPTTSLRAAFEGEKREPIPLRAGHMPGHRAQRFVDAFLIAKAFLQHLHGHALSLELASEPSAWSRQAAVPRITSPLSGRPG